MLGNSTVCTYYKGQAVIALSSSDAEYHRLVRLRVDGRHSWNCDWEPTRAWTSETHRHRVPLGASDGHRRQDLTRKNTTKEMLADFLTTHVDAATLQSCIAGLGMRFQSGESKLTLKA